MAGIVSTLEAHHDIGPLAEPIDDLALALVAPLRADHGDIAHQLLPPRTGAGAPSSSTKPQPRRCASPCQSAALLSAAIVIQPSCRNAAARPFWVLGGNSTLRCSAATGRVERIVSV